MSKYLVSALLSYIYTSYTRIHNSDTKGKMIIVWLAFGSFPFHMIIYNQEYMALDFYLLIVFYKNQLAMSVFIVHLFRHPGWKAYIRHIQILIMNNNFGRKFHYCMVLNVYRKISFPTSGPFICRDKQTTCKINDLCGQSC